MSNAFVWKLLAVPPMHVLVLVTPPVDSVDPPLIIYVSKKVFHIIHYSRSLIGLGCGCFICLVEVGMISCSSGFCVTMSCMSIVYRLIAALASPTAVPSSRCSPRGLAPKVQARALCCAAPSPRCRSRNTCSSLPHGRLDLK